MGLTRFGPLLIPAAASLYAAYMVWEQIFGGYRSSTVYYAAVLGAAIIILGAVTGYREMNAKAAEEVEERTPVPREHYIQLFAVLASTSLLVLFFEEIGYLAGFFFYPILVLLIVGVRSWRLILGTSLGIILLIHFVFVWWMQLSLPAGFLGGLL